MRNNLLMRFTAISALVIAITYGVIASMSIREDFNILYLEVKVFKKTSMKLA